MLAQYLQGLLGDRKNSRDDELVTYAYNPAWEQKKDDYNEAWVKRWLHATAVPLTPSTAPPPPN
ncbi:hypothetical protein PN477_09260, partial [Spirulina subsalsa CS-330]